MKRLLLAALATCLLAIPAIDACAQYGDEPAPKLGFKVGVFSPAGTRFKDDLKNIWRCLGVEYALTSDEFERPTTAVGALITGSESGLVEASMVGLQCEKRWYANKEEDGSLYYGAGLGYYMLKARSRDFQWEDWTERSGGKFGATAAVGYQFKGSYFGELRYSYSGELDNGLDFSGVNANIGMRLEF